MNRPYFNKSIQDLEEMFSEHSSDVSTCKKLLEELSHRSTQRAQNLKKKIETANNDHRIIPTQNTTEPQTESTAHSEPKNSKNAEQEQSRIPQLQPRIHAGPKPEVTNEPENVLRAWSALEVLSPQSYKREQQFVGTDTGRLARLDKNPDLPWERGEKSRPNRRLYYELVLGAIEMGPTIEALLQVYADKRPDKPTASGASPIATVILDKEGRPLEEDDSFTISSFAWGAPIALQGDLSRLSDWTYHEKSLGKAFQKILIKRDRNEEILPVSRLHIDQLFTHLVAALNLKNLNLRKPYFALRHFEFYASKTPPEPLLLNSFYLEDLATVRKLAENDTLPRSLRYYLGVDVPSQKIDLLNDIESLQDTLQPKATPLGRWPTNGRFPLAPLQQAAVNATQTPHMDETAVLGVNGPPGTGKTTLLRDVVAARIVERADVMASYSKPADAFKPTKMSLQRKGAKVTLHKLDDQLKGFEMVVTSSNNKAVENVTAELPGLDAVADDAPELRYFKSISDNILSRETWGVIAAVLGNSSNRYQFAQSFWRDEEHGLSTYLNHASGVPQFVNEPQDDGPPIKRLRKIVEAEKPPSSAREANDLWTTARDNYLWAQKAAEELHTKLQHVHDQIARLADVKDEIEFLDCEAVRVRDDMEEAQTQHSVTARDLEVAASHLKDAQSARDSHARLKLGFFARLFQRTKHKTWKNQLQALETTLDRNNEEFLDRRRINSGVISQINSLENEIAKTAETISRLKAEYEELETAVETAKSQTTATLPDEGFFEGNREEVQLASVWFDKAANRVRENLFEAAIKIHQAFINCAAVRLRQNLSIFVETFGTKSFGTPAKDAMISDLWSSFFLVVPVVSTTFASVHRMFKRIPHESLGWLLVDEAGQAVPQAVVGSMLRTKRSVIVGDPLQIEPVVTLPNSLTEEICGHFGIDALRYNAPEASVQTVADAASIYSAQFPTGDGLRDVGSPLLVHRRCDSPMFEISNEIAYANLMVQAKPTSSETPTLGQSAWIDVKGNPGPDKWCAEEAKHLLSMLARLKSSGESADLYIVTPFVIVKDNLRKELLSSRILEGWVGNPREWVKEHVGTVHTVQGREAKTVFFVLGAQKSTQNGARNWAGSRPNLVNVAVTRAKAAIYVIGNRELWRTAGSFRTLDRFLPVTPMQEDESRH